MRLPRWLVGGRQRPSPLPWTAWLIPAFLCFAPHAGADKTAADYFVHSLPGQPAGPLLKMHAGHVEITPETNGNLFFWHYQNRHIANRQRTVIWLNGGPGCSSMDGAMMELGPYRVKKDGVLEYNEGSWDEFANILFVDNPVGTGFSYVNTDSYLHELQEMADQFIIFMEKWFKIFPEYEHDDLYFAGESYAGQHIPYITKAVLDRNTKIENGEHHWNLKGLLIGNGWIAPKEQYQAYSKFALAEGLITQGSSEAQQVAATEATCMAELNKPGGDDHVDTQACEGILQTILDVTRRGTQCLNMYDVRIYDSWPSCGMNWPPDLESVKPYLRRADVVEAIHINRDKRTGWTECSGAVSSNFRAAHSKPSIQLLPEILEAGVPIVLFSGAKDMICNHIGTEMLINNMAWSGGTGLELSPGVWAPKRDWTFEGQPAGLYQEARNLTYVLFYNASHMVPFDWPRRTRDMLDRFMGVDIASIGGKPADSRIDGEKAGTETSVGGHPNSTIAEAEEKEKLREAELKAYYHSGEAVLVVVVIAAGLFGYWVWRGRQKQQGYMSVPLANGALEAFRSKRGADVEAGDFDVNELDDLHSERAVNGLTRDLDGGRYSLGSDSEDDIVGETGRRPGAEKRAGGR